MGSKNIKQEELFEAVSNLILPQEIEELIKEYKEAGGKRNNFLWKWSLLVFKEAGIMFSNVKKEYFKVLPNTKVVLTLFITLQDDISDKYKDQALLKELLKIPFNMESVNFNLFNDDQKNYIRFTIKVWKYIETKIKEFPNYEIFKDVFEYDLKQLLNSMAYSELVNKNPNMINLKEAGIYGCHNMAVFLYTDIDLMAAENFNVNELGDLRNIVWNAQQMARIGNWLSTWKREVKEKDFTSGIIAYAIKKGIVRNNDLLELNADELIKKIDVPAIKNFFMSSWKKNYEEINSFSSTITSIDIKKLLDGLKKLLELHLLSEGYK